MSKSKKRGTSNNLALDVSKQKQFNQTVMSKKGQKVTDHAAMTGVVYISHLPWGFEEQPLLEYFTQFGRVKKLRVSRSKKTGNNKGYAYLQFAHNDVAKIVAESMNNYLMFGKLIKCKHLEKPHPSTFRNANRGYKTPVSQEKAIKRHNYRKGEEKLEKNKKRAVSKLEKKLEKLKQSGIDYSLDTVKTSPRKRKISGEWTEMATSKSPKLESPARATTGNTPCDAAKLLLGKKTPKRQSLLPKMVDTPTGKKNVLVEDSSEDEISFKTPPFSIKSSRLDTPASVKRDSKSSPTAKQTPKSTPKSKQALKSPSESKIKNTQVSGTQGTDNVVSVKTPKAGSKVKQTLETVSMVDNTPKSVKKLRQLPSSDRRRSLRQIEAKQKK